VRVRVRVRIYMLCQSVCLLSCVFLLYVFLLFWENTFCLREHILFSACFFCMSSCVFLPVSSESLCYYRMCSLCYYRMCSLCYLECVLFLCPLKAFVTTECVLFVTTECVLFVSTECVLLLCVTACFFCMSSYVFLPLSVSVSVCVCASVCLVHLSVCLSVCMYVCPSLLMAAMQA